MTEPILIVGTGALASLFAARLSAVGAAVTMLGSWREGLAALRLYGVTLVQADGKQQAYPVTVTNDPKDCRGIANALVLVKSWQTESIAEKLSQCLPQQGVALTLQNGLGNREKLEAALGQERVAMGVTTTGATLLSSGRVRPGGEGIISVAAHPRLGTIQSYLQKAGFRLEEIEKLDTLLWSKLVINAAINPITALLKVDNGAILDRHSARQLMADLAAEVAAVAQAQGIRLSFKDPVLAAETVAQNTAENYSSMYQDILRGAPTEINAICGEVVRLGRELGVATPVNYTLWQLVQAVVEKEINGRT